MAHLKTLTAICAIVLALGGVAHREACAQQPAPAAHQTALLRLPHRPQLREHVRMPWPTSVSRTSWANGHSTFPSDGSVKQPAVVKQNATADFMTKELRALDEFANPEKYAGDGAGPVLRFIPDLIVPSYGITAKAVF